MTIGRVWQYKVGCTDEIPELIHIRVMRVHSEIPKLKNFIWNKEKNPSGLKGVNDCSYMCVCRHTAHTHTHVHVHTMLIMEAVSANILVSRFTL